MRAIFRDSGLAVAAMPFIARGMIVAIMGFNHANWAVRNSSLLCFSAIMHRALRLQYRQTQVDGRNGSSGSSSKGMMSSVEFFSQFPQMYPFLLQELETSTRDDEKNLGLYPMLLLLSRLQPAEEQGEHGEEEAKKFPMDVFLPSLQRCGRHRFHMHRLSINS